MHANLEADRLRALMRAASDVIWTTSPAGDFVEPQPDWEEFTGQSFEQYRGAGWLDAVHPDDRERLARAWRAALDSSSELRSEYRLRRRDGEYRLMRVSAVPVLEADGRIREWVGIEADITDVRRAELEVELGRARLEAVFREAPALIALLSGPDHVFELVNPAYQQAVGDRPLLGLPVRRAMPEIEGQGFFELLDNVYATGQPHVANEVRALIDPTRTGVLEEIWFNYTYQPVRTSTGAVTGILAFAVDVTQQVRTRAAIEEQATELEQQTEELQQQAAHLEEMQVELETANENLQRTNLELEAANEALRASEAQFRTLAEAIPQLAWIARPDGHIFWYNQRWYEYTGTTPEQMEGWGWQSVHDPQMLPQVIERWRTSIATGEPFDMEFPLRGADGSFRWFLTRVMPVRDESGRVTGWFGTNTDVDDRRNMERSLDEARRAAEAANRAKSAFLAHMSHELRTPINAIVGYAQLLEMGLAGPLNDKQTEQVQRVIGSSQHLLALVAGILDLAKIEAGAADVNTVLFPPGEVLESALDLTRPAATAKDVTLRQAGELPAGVRAVADPDRVRQVVANLLVNAVKFSPPGAEVLVETKVTRTADGAGLDGAGPWLRVDVVDHGIGIGPDDLDRIFEPFYQVDSGYTREGGGTGLGLTISRKLARAMGGELVAESSVGAGSRFTLWLRATDS